MRAWRKTSRRTGVQCGLRLLKYSPLELLARGSADQPMAATMIETLREEVTSLEAELSQKIDDTPSGELCKSDSAARGLEEHITRNNVGAHQSSPRCLSPDNAKFKCNSRRRSLVQFEQVVASLPPATGPGEGAVCCATASGQDISGKLQKLNFCTSNNAMAAALAPARLPSSGSTGVVTKRTSSVDRPNNAMAAALAPARLPSSGSTGVVTKRTSSVDRPHRTASSDSTNSKKVNFTHFTVYAHSLERELSRRSDSFELGV